MARPYVSVITIKGCGDDLIHTKCNAFDRRYASPGNYDIYINMVTETGIKGLELSTQECVHT